MCPDGRRRRRRQASDVRRRLPQRMNGATQIESRVDVAARTAPAGLRDHVNASSHVRDFGHRPAGRDGERSQRVVVVLGPRSASDRLFWVTLRRVWTRWSDMLVLVKPETVIQWHRAGFRKYWTWLARRQRTGRPSIKTGLRELILRMAAENPTLGGLRAFTASSECWGSPSPSVRSQGISLVSGQVPARSSGGSNSFAITAT